MRSYGCFAEPLDAWDGGHPDYRDVAQRLVICVVRVVQKINDRIRRLFGVELFPRGGVVVLPTVGRVTRGRPAVPDDEWVFHPHILPHIPMLEAHILAHSEEDIIGWTIAHYQNIGAARVVVHDLGSEDGTVDIAVGMGAVVKQHRCHDFNDADNVQLKNTCWAASSADWVAVVDADELLHSPTMPFPDLLETYESTAIPVAKPHGFELCADEFPVYQPGRQLTDLVKHGARDDHWYAKPVLFTPRRVMYMNFAPGAHKCDAVLSDGRHHGNPTIPTTPPVYLLHAKHIGPVERVAERYVRNQRRHSELNKRMRWGNYEPPLKHAQDKRRSIMGELRQVIP
jgi:hypothetical protein